MSVYVQTAFLVLALLLVLHLDSRRVERAVWRDWELMLTPRGERALRAVEAQAQDEMALAALALDEAAKVRLLSVDDAIRLLETGYSLIERFSPDMRRLLAGMAVFSRMVAAMAPVPPLRPQEFRIGHLVNLAHLDRLLHQFLVSTGERFRLKVFILRRGFEVATHFLFHAKERIGHGIAAGPEWEAVAAARSDFGTLTNESLRTFRALLTSLAAERK